MDDLIVHLPGDGFCRGLAYRDAFWADCQQPQNGTVVTCGVCGKVGILPDPGHEQEYIRGAFEAAGTTVTEEGDTLTATWVP